MRRSRSVGYALTCAMLALGAAAPARALDDLSDAALWTHGKELSERAMRLKEGTRQAMLMQMEESQLLRAMPASDRKARRLQANQGMRHWTDQYMDRVGTPSTVVAAAILLLAKTPAGERAYLSRPVASVCSAMNAEQHGHESLMTLWTLGGAAALDLQDTAPELVDLMKHLHAEARALSWDTAQACASIERAASRP